MGQSCTAGSRIFVQESIYPAFLERFTALAKDLADHTGSPFDPDTQHGPQISQTQFDRVMGFIDSGKQEGANVAIGGERHGQEGYFIKPTVFTNVNPKMSIMQDEIFGPVCSIMKFKTEEGRHQTFYFQMNAKIKCVPFFQRYLKLQTMLRMDWERMFSPKTRVGRSESHIISRLEVFL